VLTRVEIEERAEPILPSGSPLKEPHMRIRIVGSAALVLAVHRPSNTRRRCGLLE